MIVEDDTLVLSISSRCSILRCEELCSREVPRDSVRVVYVVFLVFFGQFCERGYSAIWKLDQTECFCKIRIQFEFLVELVVGSPTSLNISRVPQKLVIHRIDQLTFLAALLFNLNGDYEILRTKNLIHDLAHMMDVLVADLDEDAAALSQQFAA